MSLMPLQPAGLAPFVPPPSDATRTRGHRLRPPSWRQVLLVLVAVAATAGVGFLVWSTRISPVTVRVARLATNVPEDVFGLGTVGARVESNVGFKVSGVLVALHADSGDRVAAGAVLAKLDDRDVRGAAPVGQGGRVAGGGEYRQGGRRCGQRRRQPGQCRGGQPTAARPWCGTVSSRRRRRRPPRRPCASRAPICRLPQSEKTVARAGLAAAQAQEEFAAVAVDNYTLRAPYDAWVVARNLQLGSMPIPGQAVFTLVDPQTDLGAGLCGRAACRPDRGRPGRARSSCAPSPAGACRAMSRASRSRATR